MMSAKSSERINETQEANQILPSWTNSTAVKMAKLIVKTAIFEIDFSIGRSPLFSILTSYNALSSSNLVTQGRGSVENIIKVGY